MKNITKSIIALFAVLAISCNADDVEDRPVVLPVDAPVLLAPEENNSYILAPEDGTQQAERFVWTEANFDEDVAVTYVVQIDKAGNEFANAQDLGSIIGSTLLSVSVETLNDKVMAAGANAFELAQFEVRVKASLNDTFEPIYSNVVKISVTPYTTETPKVYAIGNFLSASGYGSDWSPASTLPALAASGFGETDFEGYVYMNVSAPEFKILPTNTSFDGDYGDDGTFSGTLAQEGESNISLSAGGYYRIQADTDALTYSATATQWGIAGNATTNGWDGMLPMTYNPTTKKWSIITTLATQSAPDNGLKFKANGAWDINLGDSGADGSAEYNGTNISTTAGTYLIELDLSNPRDYKYTLTPQ
jgi:starch-binding outer membrane protein SusE/F